MSRVDIWSNESSMLEGVLRLSFTGRETTTKNKSRNHAQAKSSGHEASALGQFCQVLDLSAGIESNDWLKPWSSIR
jgi:hypothetical protein